MFQFVKKKYVRTVHTTDLEYVKRLTTNNILYIIKRSFSNFSLNSMLHVLSRPVWFIIEWRDIAIQTSPEMSVDLYLLLNLSHNYMYALITNLIFLLTLIVANNIVRLMKKTRKQQELQKRQQP